MLLAVGADGVGKTQWMRRLLAKCNYVKLVESTTTRGPRPSDLPGEYKEVSLAEFIELDRDGSFIQSFWHAGESYATEKFAVLRLNVFSMTVSGIAAVIPSAIPYWYRFFQDDDNLRSYRMVVVNILAPETVRRKRMRLRGDSEESLARKLVSSRDFDAQLEASLPGGVEILRLNNDFPSADEFYDHALTELRRIEVQIH